MKTFKMFVRIVALSAVFVGVGCGQAPTAPSPPAEEPKPAPEVVAQTGPDVKLPEGYPTALVYPGSVHERAVATPNEKYLISTSIDDAEKVLAFYRAEMPRAKYPVSTTLTPDSTTTILLGRVGETEFSVTVHAGSPTRIEAALKKQDEM